MRFFLQIATQAGSVSLGAALADDVFVALLLAPLIFVIIVTRRVNAVGV
jgi:hypothetical protein